MSAPAAPERIEFFAPLRGVVQGTLIGVLIVGVSAWMVFDAIALGNLSPCGGVLGGCGVLLGAVPLIGGLRLARFALPRRPVVVFDAHGAHDKRWRHGAVPWATVRAAEDRRGGHGGAHTLRLELVGQPTGVDAVDIDFANLRPGIERAFAFLQEHPELLHPDATPPRV